MKKAIYLIAATALMTGCNQDVLVDTHEPMPEAPRRIGFESFVNKSTRAEGTNSTNLQDFYSSFNVYGWKTVGTTTTPVFDNIKVSYYDGVDTTPSEEWGTDAPAGWYYENIRYWDKMAGSYLFSAYAPVEATDDVACDEEGLITIGAEEPITVEGTNLMATPAKELAFTGFKYDYMTAQSEETLDKVSLTFKHLLAKLNIRIKLDEDVTTAQNVAVQKIEVHNLGDKASYSNAEGVGVTGWTLGTATADYVPAVEAEYSLNADENYNGYYVMEQLIIPQTITKPTTAVPSLEEYPEACIYVEYTIGGETFKSYSPLANIFLVAESKAVTSYTFNGGNQYTINITVGPAPIEFEAEVAVWEEATEKDLILD